MLKKSVFFIFFILCSFMFFSCTTELTLQLNKNGSVDVRFSGGAGEAFTKMLMSASESEDLIYDVDEITLELVKAGFSKVKVDVKNKTDLNISMTDANKASFLFTSGICNVTGNKLKVNLTAEKLKSFYDSADEMLQMYLDLFLAPIFNDEKMDETEYVEMISSFYGSSAAKELEHSNLKLTLINSDDSKVSMSLSLVELLTLYKPVNIN